MAKSDTVGKRNKRLKLRDYSLQSRTLQRYSSLSCMNILVRNPAIVDGSSSNPAMNIMLNEQKNACNAIEFSSSVRKIKRRKLKQACKQLLRLKTIGN